MKRTGVQVQATTSKFLSSWITTLLQASDQHNILSLRLEGSAYISEPTHATRKPESSWIGAACGGCPRVHSVGEADAKLGWKGASAVADMEEVSAEH